MTARARLDETHDPLAISWLPSANGHPEFPLQNLPLGIFSSRTNLQPRGGMAIGDQVLDLGMIAPLLSGIASHAAKAAGAPTLNALLATGRQSARALRHGVFELLTDRARENLVRPALTPQSECQLHLPAAIGDYTDFYTGIHHATNIGKQFRPDAPLLPNYKYVPIGYHGRASSVRLSGASVVRPKSQIKKPDEASPVYAPTQRLDYELEMGVWISGGNNLGSPIAMDAADEHVAGLCLLNDWSARDVQVWEYQPLGPFLAKNFLTSISPWIVTADALAPYRIAQPPRPDGDPVPLPYLMSAADQAGGAYAITMEVYLRTQKMRDAHEPACRLSRGPMSSMYWTVAQLVAHHTCNGCNLQPGDLLGTGTLSGAERSSMGCLLELTEGGRVPLQLPNGEQRTFLQDGDELTMTAHAEAPDRVRIGFGSCVGTVSPAR
jgi:fumarylacetoacetase